MEKDRYINLCDSCELGPYSPECPGEDLEFGDGRGLDNIIACSAYDELCANGGFDQDGE